ncbi:hypothetical protein PTSG_06011 [Salpingoeca rosetta]|uniref:PH domain-containing protein n=1 Tax=Salpingoeca rosetta (strain ATCC 50818 / BSB-021) TaxID=946362 RepID=F2UDF1_SALR5|nr:uncharacterized protein PTSG_06011 [Salpingoeca rosetta]EGD74646.1 hypothetical protein PTSG_06011 [Salpingoeca rosetta]|eukprot:XP_004992903.1 hypothetical protein PTSG_06011 [Salpingoeca rosetta]
MDEGGDEGSSVPTVGCSASDVDTIEATRDVDTLPRQELLTVFSFFHGIMTRHAAETLLLHGGPGMYLLREIPSEEGERTGTLCLSVRNLHAVSHFLVSWNGKEFQIGPSVYSSVQTFADFFACPGFFDGNGNKITLGSPYPREVYEKHLYDKVQTQMEWGSGVESSRRRKKKKKPQDERCRSMQILRASTESKEGYLTKLGKVRKTWKVRWFSVTKNEFRYYNQRGDSQPIRVLDLCECKRVERTEVPGKFHAFCVEMPTREFLMYAATEDEADAWVAVLQAKLEAVQSLTS